MPKPVLKSRIPTREKTERTRGIGPNPVRTVTDKEKVTPSGDTDFSQVRSEFVRAKLGNTPWKNRSYIENLMKLEYFVSKGGGFDFGGALHFHHLKTKYWKEYKALLKELRPEEYPRYLAEMEEQVRSYKLQKEGDRRALARSRRSWTAAGGRI